MFIIKRSINMARSFISRLNMWIHFPMRCLKENLSLISFQITWILILSFSVFCALGLYLKSRQIVFFRMLPLQLAPETYSNKTPIALSSDTNDHIEVKLLKEALEYLGAHPIEQFDGNFSSLLAMENFGAFSFKKRTSSYGDLLAYYNTTYTHSLPIILNLFHNSMLR